MQNVFTVMLGFGVFIVLVMIALRLFRGYEQLARRALIRAYSGLNTHNAPQPGDVFVTYHTYHGIIAWFTQTPHAIIASPDQSRILLKRLLRFNLTWGLTSYGLIFVPILAITNYYSQLRSIARQAQNTDASINQHQPSDSTMVTYPTATTDDVLNGKLVRNPGFTLRRLAGGTMIFLTLMAVLIAVASASDFGNYSAAVVPCIVALGIAWLGYRWVRH